MSATSQGCTPAEVKQESLSGIWHHMTLHLPVAQPVLQTSQIAEGLGLSRKVKARRHQCIPWSMPTCC